MSFPDLSQRFKKILLDEKHTDCSFCIDETVLNGHKIILSSASPVFEAMFYGPMAVTNKSNGLCIKIEDINLDIFQMMLMYIYTDEIDVAHATVEDLIELSYCADKYLIAGLLDKCVALIKSSLRHANILKALDLSIYMNIAELINACMSFFNKYCLTCSNFIKTILQNQFHISKECLNYILKCNIKEQNINLVHLIREWCKFEAKVLGIDVQDTDTILEGVNVPEDLRNDLKNIHSLVISDNSLKNSQHSWILCQRFYYRAIRPLEISHNPIFKTSLIPDRCIALRSLIINSRLAPILRNCPNSYAENVKVNVYNEQQELVYNQKFVIFNVEYNSNIYLVFENPVILMANAMYTIEFSWDQYFTAGCEYPRSVFPQKEVMNLCTITFDANIDNRLFNEHGNILNGLEYVILS